MTMALITMLMKRKMMKILKKEGKEGEKKRKKSVPRKNENRKGC